MFHIAETSGLNTVFKHKVSIHLNVVLSELFVHYYSRDNFQWAYSVMCNYILNSLKRGNFHSGWLFCYLSRMLVKFVLNKMINNRFKHMSD